MESTIESKLKAECAKIVTPVPHVVDTLSCIRNMLMMAQNFNTSNKYELAYKMAYKAIMQVNAAKNIPKCKQTEEKIQQQLSNLQHEMKYAVEMLSKLNFVKPSSQKNSKEVPKKEEKKKDIEAVNAFADILTLYVPTGLIKEFILLAEANTYANKETCGVLCGNQINGVYTITCIIVPKQLGNSSSCLMKDEEEVSQYQEQENLITMGWIHTHPKYVI